MYNGIEGATKSVEKKKKQLEWTPYKPEFHFSAPAFWLNDPNGTTFYEGEYHLFYQHNPFGEKWGHMHWGHAKSEDLIVWDHLPIALAPAKDKGEKHVFSGCCVMDPEGTPTIFYTSIKNLLNVWKGAEQWIAKSQDKLKSWKRIKNNPVLTEDIHDKIRVRNWRDPYVWFDNLRETYYMVMGGNIANWKFWNKCGSIFLYKSKNLREWCYEGILHTVEKDVARIVECPNFFTLGEKYVLVISTIFDHGLKYAIGTFDGHRFYTEGDNPWRMLDYGKPVYASNTFFDEKGRTILISWVKGGGKGGWNGLMSLPRELSLDDESKLVQKPITELKKYRARREERNNLRIEMGHKEEMLINLGPAAERLLKIKCSNKPIKGGIRFWNSAKSETKPYKFELIFKINWAKNAYFKLCNESAIIKLSRRQKKQRNNVLQIRMILDRSVAECFIDDKEVLTARFYPKISQMENTKDLDFNVAFFCKRGTLTLEKTNVFSLKKRE